MTAWEKISWKQQLVTMPMLFSFGINMLQKSGKTYSSLWSLRTEMRARLTQFQHYSSSCKKSMGRSIINWLISCSFNQTLRKQMMMYVKGWALRAFVRKVPHKELVDIKGDEFQAAVLTASQDSLMLLSVPHFSITSAVKVQDATFMRKQAVT